MVVMKRCSISLHAHMDALKVIEDDQEPSYSSGRAPSRGSSSPFSGFKSPAKRLGNPAQRSASFRGLQRPSPPALRPSPPTPPRRPCRTASRLWSETFASESKRELSTRDVRRQEAIFELFQGEQDLVEDLKLTKMVYQDPMRKLNIMSEEESQKIFGSLQSLVPLHQELVERLQEARGPDGSVERMGQILLNWVPRLRPAYRGYCSSQAEARALLEWRRRDEERVSDFLRRCRESPFSRRLDLSSFLDEPRSRLVKYPLLLREVLRHTGPAHPDTTPLQRALEESQALLEEMDALAGEAECRFFLERLELGDGEPREPREPGGPGGPGAAGALGATRSLRCQGELRNLRGTKVHVFVFGTALVVSRPGSRAAGGRGPRYRVTGRPIPACDLELYDLRDGEVKAGGSFRGAFGASETAKNFFKVGFRNPAHGPSHTLQTSDSFSKQQWLGHIRASIAEHQQDLQQHQQYHQQQQQQQQQQGLKVEAPPVMMRKRGEVLSRLRPVSAMLACPRTSAQVCPAAGPGAGAGKIGAGRTGGGKGGGVGRASGDGRGERADPGVVDVDAAGDGDGKWRTSHGITVKVTPAGM
ncbi:unnamed protein product [Lampetra planeri]